jgi:hypothetical protein
MGPNCESESSFYSDVSVQPLAGSGIVALASPRLHGLLADGFSGSGDRGQATSYIVQAAMRVLQDRFSLVYVFPASPLSGSTSYQQYWGARGLGGTNALEGAIIGGNPSTSGYKAALHEMTHNFVSPSKINALLANNVFGSHWGTRQTAERSTEALATRHRPSSGARNALSGPSPLPSPGR